MKIQFIKDYTLTVDNPSCKNGMIGCQPSTTTNFKLGQIVSGGIRGGSLDSKNFYIDYGNYTNAIPLEYLKVLNDDGTPYGNPNNMGNNQTNQVAPKKLFPTTQNTIKTIQPISVIDPKLAQQISEQMDKEDKKRRQIKFGIVLLAIALGYFAYKKFKN
jgi:hypothetical protein